MKVRYDGEGDTLDIIVSGNQIHHAEEYGTIIMNYDKENRLVEIEILNAGKFIGELVKGIAEAKPKTKFVEIGV